MCLSPGWRDLSHCLGLPVREDSPLCRLLSWEMWLRRSTLCGCGAFGDYQSSSLHSGCSSEGYLILPSDAPRLYCLWGLPMFVILVWTLLSSSLSSIHSVFIFLHIHTMPCLYILGIIKKNSKIVFQTTGCYNCEILLYFIDNVVSIIELFNTKYDVLYEPHINISITSLIGIWKISVCTSCKCECNWYKVCILMYILSKHKKTIS